MKKIFKNKTIFKTLKTKQQYTQQQQRIKFFLNGKEVSVPADKNLTIYEACSLWLNKVNKIPVICHHPRLKPTGNCRICLVELGEKNTNSKPVSEKTKDIITSGSYAKMIPSCTNKIEEGMNIWTNSERVDENVKGVLKFMLSSHRLDCPTCVANTRCEFQNLLERYNVKVSDLPKTMLEKYKKLHHEEHHTKNNDEEWEEIKEVKKILKNNSIELDLEKCIKCMRCVRMCRDVQGMSVLSMVERGNMEHISPLINEMDHSNIESGLNYDCIGCGQCSNVCPVGAIKFLSHYEEAENALKNKSSTGKILIVQTAPSVRVQLGEGLGLEPNTITDEYLVNGLKQLGFDYVFDTQFTADLTIMEESAELLQRVEKGGPFPMFTSCCPGWVNLIEQHYPEFIPNLSSCKSPQGMLGALVKKYFSKKINVKPEDIILVSIMPCTAKKDEAYRPQLKGDVDYVLTTRELLKLFKRNFVHLSDFKDDKKLEFDNPLGESTGAAYLFGVTGGVMEAALRTAYEVGLKKPLPKIEFDACRGLDGIKEAEIDFGGLPVKIAIANGTGNLRKLLETIKSGEKTYHFVEAMACPAGCIGGGGAPKNIEGDPDLIKKRMLAIYSKDEKSVIRKSHENTHIKKLYEEYLGKPLGHKAHDLLHTHYSDRQKKN